MGDRDRPWGCGRRSSGGPHGRVHGSVRGGRAPSLVRPHHSRGTRGIILLLSQLTARQTGELDARGLPFVVIDPTAEPGPEVSSVGATNWSGGLAATKHLVDLGHRRVGIITGPPELAVQPGAPRRLPCRPREGGPFGGRRAGESRATSGSGPATSRRRYLFGLSPRPTAIFAGNDLSALGVLRGSAGSRSPCPRGFERRRFR